MSAKRDLEANLAISQSLEPISRVGSSDGTGASVDLLGYDGALAVADIGTWVAGTHTPKLQESADGTTFTDVGTADLIGAFSAVTSTATDQTVQIVGYKGTSRYLRGYVTVTSGGTAGQGAVTGFLIVRGHPEQAPV